MYNSDIFSVMCYDRSIKELVDLSIWDSKIRCCASLCRGTIVACICRRPGFLANYCFSSPHKSVLTISPHFIFLVQFFFFLQFSSSVKPNNANDTRIAPVASSPKVEDTLQVADTGAAGGTEVGNLEIDRSVKVGQSRSI